MTLGIVLALAGALHAAEVPVAAKGHAVNPSWSPDGQYLAFELNDLNGKVELYVAKIQSGNPVGTPTKVNLPGATSSFAAAGSIAAAPAWHPQGMLIFEGSSAGGTNRLYFWQPGGQSAAELLNNGQIGGDLSWPSVAANGKVISFVSDATGSGDIYTWDRGTNKVAQLLNTPYTEAAPRYNTTSDKIAFSRKNQGTEDLYTFAAGTAAAHIGGAGDQSRPAWVGSSLLYFTNERGDEHWDIAISGAPNEKKILARDVRLPQRASPAVTPDGKWVVYGVQNPEAAHAIMFTSIDGAKTAKYDGGLVATGEPSVTLVNGRYFLAYSALPSAGADWRQLHVADVTDLLK